MKLVHDVVGAMAPDAPEAWLLHGILGSGRNWRGFVRHLSRRLPAWRFVVPDLRGHGESTPAVGPHTVAQCALDLAETMAARRTDPQVVIGHSFGGKVAIAYQAHAPEGLRSTWVLDTVPGLAEPGGAGDDDVSAVLDAIAAVPLPIGSYEDLIETLTSKGFSEGLAQWMTTNLARTDEGFVWQLEIPVVRALLADYAAVDLWDAVQAPSVPLHLLRAGRSSRWSSSDITRWEALSGRSHAHLLADAGHWVHVDAPEALQDLLADDLDAVASQT